MKKIVVVGGVTMDLLYNVPKFPEIGKAVEAHSYTLTPGGKALTIATCLQRMHAKVEIISSIGKDYFAARINETLLEEQFSVENLVIQENIPTDLISVIVPPHGRPGYIGTHSANYALTVADIDTKKQLIESSDALIVTLEIPSLVAKRALEIAKNAHIPTFVTPSPPDNFSKEVLQLADYLILDEWQSEIISGMNNKYSEENILKYFAENYKGNILITKDKEGCVLIKDGKIEMYTEISHKHVDATGFNSAFIAILTLALVNDEKIKEAIRKANAAGALAKSKIGSRESMPTRRELKASLKTYTVDN